MVNLEVVTVMFFSDVYLIKMKMPPSSKLTFHSHCDTYLCWWKLGIPKFLLNLFILIKQYYYLHLHVPYYPTFSLPACNYIFCQVTKMTQVKVCFLGFLGCPCHLFLKFLFVKILISWACHLENLAKTKFIFTLFIYVLINIRLMTDNSKQVLALALSHLAFGRKLYFQNVSFW